MCQWFKSNHVSLENKPGRDRLSDFDDQALEQAEEEDKSLITGRRVLCRPINHCQALQKSRKSEEIHRMGSS